MITTFCLEVITVLPEWVDKMESGDSRLALSVRIARSQAAALAENAACYSSVANIGRYQLDQTHHEATILSLLAFRERTDCYCMLVMAMRRRRTRPYPDERRDQKSHTSRGCITRESVAAGVEESHHGITSADSSSHQLHCDTVPERVPHQLTPCALSG